MDMRKMIFYRLVPPAFKLNRKDQRDKYWSDQISNIIEDEVLLPNAAIKISKIPSKGVPKHVKFHSTDCPLAKFPYKDYQNNLFSLKTCQFFDSNTLPQKKCCISTKIMPSLMVFKIEQKQKRHALNMKMLLISFHSIFSVRFTS